MRCIDDRSNQRLEKNRHIGARRQPAANAQPRTGFDLFDGEPHYHYIEPSGERQTIVDFDRVALGPMLPWALDQIRHRLAPMLEHAGGHALVPQLDAKRIEASLQEVEKLAREAEAALAAGTDRRRGKE